eukprot:434747-Prymnesium_polylepis.1
MGHPHPRRPPRSSTRRACGRPSETARSSCTRTRAPRNAPRSWRACRACMSSTRHVIRRRTRDARAQVHQRASSPGRTLT